MLSVMRQMGLVSSPQCSDRYTLAEPPILGRAFNARGDAFRLSMNTA
jgi:hypothetical protein